MRASRKLRCRAKERPGEGSRSSSRRPRTGAIPGTCQTPESRPHAPFSQRRCRQPRPCSGSQPIGLSLGNKPHPQPLPQPPPQDPPQPHQPQGRDDTRRRSSPRPPVMTRRQADRAIRPTSRDPAPPVRPALPSLRPVSALSCSLFPDTSHVLPPGLLPVSSPPRHARPSARPRARSRPNRPARAPRCPHARGVWAGQRTLARTSNPARTCQRHNTSTRPLPAPGRSHTRAPAGPGMPANS